MRLLKTWSETIEHFKGSRVSCASLLSVTVFYGLNKATCVHTQTAHGYCMSIIKWENKQKGACHWSLPWGLFQVLFSSHLSTSFIYFIALPILSPLFLSQQSPSPIILCSSFCLPARTLQPYSLDQYKQNYKCTKHVVQVPIQFFAFFIFTWL